MLAVGARYMIAGKFFDEAKTMLRMGIGFAALQAVMHVYLPGKVARTSDTFGSLAATIAVLGNLFIIGRLVTLSLVVDAVLHERYGSLTQRIFALPVLRSIPAHSRRLAAYFDIAPDRSGGAGPPDVG